MRACMENFWRVHNNVKVRTLNARLNSILWIMRPDARVPRVCIRRDAQAGFLMLWIRCMHAASIWAQCGSAYRKHRIGAYCAYRELSFVLLYGNSVLTASVFRHRYRIKITRTHSILYLCISRVGLFHVCIYLPGRVVHRELSCFVLLPAVE